MPVVECSEKNCTCSTIRPLCQQLERKDTISQLRKGGDGLVISFHQLPHITPEIFALSIDSSFLSPGNTLVSAPDLKQEAEADNYMYHVSIGKEGRLRK